MEKGISAHTANASEVGQTAKNLVPGDIVKLKVDHFPRNERKLARVNVEPTVPSDDCFVRKAVLAFGTRLLA